MTLFLSSGLELADFMLQAMQRKNNFRVSLTIGTTPGPFEGICIDPAPEHVEWGFGLYVLDPAPERVRVEFLGVCDDPAPERVEWVK